MIRRPPRSTRTDTLFPYTTLCRSAVFNFEGGCYAKMICLSAEAEPEIHATMQRFGTILENVVMHPETRALDLDDASLAENSRGAYPIHFIPNASCENMGPEIGRAHV